VDQVRERVPIQLPITEIKVVTAPQKVLQEARETQVLLLRVAVALVALANLLALFHLSVALVAQR
jgi:hypothetical protein